MNTERLFVIYLKFILNWAPYGQGSRKPSYQEPSFSFCVLVAQRKSGAPAASVSSSVKWDRDRKLLMYKTGPRCSKTRLWEAWKLHTAEPGMAFPATATQGQKHLELEASLWVRCHDQVISHLITQQTLTGPIVTEGLWG